MKFYITVVILILLSVSLNAQNAGYNEISQGFYIYEANADDFTVSSNLNDVIFEGWNVYGVDRVKVYINTYIDGNDYPFPESVWEEIVSLSPGENETYLDVRCNSYCSPNNSTTTPITFTYVKAFETNEIYISETNGDVTLEWHYYVPRNVVFYYRVYRNTSISLTGGQFIEGWGLNNSYIDTSPKTPGTTYYYWIEAAVNSTGWRKSGIVEDNYKSVTIQVELNVNPSSLNYTSTGGTQATNITSNVSWSVTTSDSWITVSQASGTGDATLDISVSNSEESRSGTVTISGSGVTRVVNINQTGNPPTIETLMPADNSFDIAINTNLEIVFNKAMNAVSGKYINIYKSGGSLISSIEATDSQVSINNDTVTINPVNNLEGGLNYYVLIDAGAFVDNSSNNFNGISDPSIWNFTTLLLPPTNVIATPISTSEIELTWDVVSAADSYSIFSCGESITYATSITATNYIADSLNPESYYDFIVKSVTTDTISNASNCVSATTFCTHTWGEPVIYTTGTIASGIVTINDDNATEDDQVGAFVNGELRAVDNVVLYGGVSYISFNIHGETVETVSFIVWDQSECEEVPVQFTTNINPGGAIGTPPNYLPIDADSTLSMIANITGEGDVDLSPAGGNYNLNEEVTLTATPNVGWQFESWTGDLSGSINPETITMNDNKTVMAIFNQVTYYVSKSGNDNSGTGTITNPVLTIVKGFELVGLPTDTVYVHNGVYFENVDTLVNHCIFFVDTVTINNNFRNNATIIIGNNRELHIQGCLINNSIIELKQGSTLKVPD